MFVSSYMEHMSTEQIHRVWIWDAKGQDAFDINNIVFVRWIYQRLEQQTIYIISVARLNMCLEMLSFFHACPGHLYDVDLLKTTVHRQTLGPKYLILQICPELNVGTKKPQNAAQCQKTRWYWQRLWIPTIRISKYFYLYNIYFLYILKYSVLQPYTQLNNKGYEKI